jgi:large subunit ribosomal protein L23
MDPRQIILEPIVTEKSTIVRELYNKYSFKVIPSATKPQIANAVETIFDVKVLKVHTVNMDGKVKRLGRNLGRRSAWKKAIVTLPAGKDIKVYEGV